MNDTTYWSFLWRSCWVCGRQLKAICGHSCMKMTFPLVRITTFGKQIFKQVIIVNHVYPLWITCMPVTTLNPYQSVILLMKRLLNSFSSFLCTECQSMCNYVERNPTDQFTCSSINNHLCVNVWDNASGPIISVYQHRVNLAFSQALAELFKNTDFLLAMVDTLRPKKNGCHFADNNFQFSPEWKSSYLDLNFTEFCAQGSNQQYIIIGSDNGLLSVRCHAIIWTNDGLAWWGIKVLFGFSELSNWPWLKSMITNIHNVTWHH